MRYNCFLFDWDGCLVNSLPLWFSAMKHALKAFRVDVPDEKINLGFSSWNYFQDYGAFNIEGFTDIVYSYVNSRLDSIEPNPGAIALLKSIRDNGGTSAIVSNADRFKIEYVMDRLNLADYFSCILGREDVTNLKPSAEPVKKALSLLKANSRDALFAGDSDVDIRSGKRAGVTTVLYSSPVNRGYHTYPGSDTIVSDFRVSNLAAITEIAGIS